MKVLKKKFVRMLSTAVFLYGVIFVTTDMQAQALDAKAAWNDVEAVDTGASVDVDAQAGTAKQYGWQTVEGKKYYISPETGERLAGIQNIEGKRYCFSPETGELLTGIQNIGGKVYCFLPETGEMHTGWIKISGKSYYFSSKNGEMLTGRRTVGDKAYFFNGSGVLQVSKWVQAGNKTYYCKKNGVLQSGWLKKEGKPYYFSPENNRMLTGWQQIFDDAGEPHKYYFTPSGAKKGVLQVNCIAGTKKAGYAYVDANGVQVTAPEIVAAVDYVIKYTDTGWTADTKLQMCFQALRDHYNYRHSHDTPTAKRMSGYAYELLTVGKGNCYRYAAGFACIAKVLGYEARVNVGNVSSVYGGMAPHGWAQVKVDGVWYLCDVNMKLYMQKKPTSRKYERFKVYRLSIQDGEVCWK